MISTKEKLPNCETPVFIKTSDGTVFLGVRDTPEEGEKEVYWSFCLPCACGWTRRPKEDCLNPDCGLRHEDS